MKRPIILPESNRSPVIESIVRYLAALPEGKRYTVKVEAYKKSRSQQQNRYLWGLVYETILKEGGEALAGWHAEDLHTYFLGEWSGWETIEGFNSIRKRPIKRSSKLSTVEFSDYVAFIQQKAAELGVYIPDPNEAYS